MSDAHGLPDCSLLGEAAPLKDSAALAEPPTPETLTAEVALTTVVADALPSSGDALQDPLTEPRAGEALDDGELLGDRPDDGDAAPERLNTDEAESAREADADADEPDDRDARGDADVLTEEEGVTEKHGDSDGMADTVREADNEGDPD